uniref:6-phosphogluconate dehydrogenase, decarboxylating n=1 Tax=Magnetococcus massalia (strain MO-1) TaxID=451514 RepID=A0A1S7LDR9_MAGMO|nr:6-phosphogluconate dehydrogenase, decarboxylating [Candidatus Magnetococcus massalia]
MGGNMVTRLLRTGQHELVVYARTASKVASFVEQGAEGAGSLAELVEKLPTPRIVWLMVPSGEATQQNLDALQDLLSAGDIIIDGGNSDWRDTQKRSTQLAEAGITLLDCGTSGGVWGLENGYCLMYGGEPAATEKLVPIYRDLAPEQGHLHCGPSGSGHFVKMVHNGIEYGMMQAFAEGFQIMQQSPYEIDLAAVSGVWRQGSVVRSWLLDLAERALKEDPELSQLAPYVSDSGEGRWTVETAIDLDVPAPVITAALFARFSSRDEEAFGHRLLAALRNQFGGHAVKSAGE